MTKDYNSYKSRDLSNADTANQKNVTKMGSRTSKKNIVVAHLRITVRNLEAVYETL